MVVFKLDLQFRSDAISNMAAIVSDLLTYEIICKLQPLDHQNNLCDFFFLICSYLFRSHILTKFKCTDGFISYLSVKQIALGHTFLFCIIKKKKNILVWCSLSGQV